MASALGLVFRIEAEVHQSVVALAGFHDDIAAIATIPTRRSAARNILFPPEGHTAVAAVPSLHPDCGFIDEHQRISGGSATKKPQPEGEALWQGPVWRGRPRPRDEGKTLIRFDGFDHHVFAQLTPVLELDSTGDLGK